MSNKYREMSNRDLLDALQDEYYESGAEGGRYGGPGATEEGYRRELERRLMIVELLAKELSRLQAGS